MKINLEDKKLSYLIIKRLNKKVCVFCGKKNISEMTISEWICSYTYPSNPTNFVLFLQQLNGSEIIPFCSECYNGKVRFSNVKNEDFVGE